MHLKAAGEKYSSTTTERKAMSTKTILKRLALIVAAALTIGGITAVSASAANSNLGCNVAYAGAAGGNDDACQGLAGPANTVTIATSSGTLREYVTISGGTFAGGAVAATLAASGAGSAITIATPAAGTITVTGYAETAAGSGIYSATATDTVTITVLAAATGTVYASSTAFIGAVGAPGSVVADAASLKYDATYAANARAQIDVAQFDATPSAMTTGSSKAVTVSISGAGSVGNQAANGGARAASASVAAGASVGGASTFWVYSDGRVGAAVVTIAVNGVTVATKNVTFYGPLAKMVATPAKTFTGIGETNAVTVEGFDAAGVSLGDVTGASAATSATTAVATAAGMTVTGHSAGTSVITITNGSVTTTFTATVTKTTAKAGGVTISFDKDSYIAGELMTVTVSAVDSNGAAVADGARNLLGATGITSSVALGANNLPAGASVALVGGKKSYTAYAPLAGGTITLSAVEGAAVDGAAAGAITASVTVTSPAEDALQAALDAIDAANAAYDAATAAGDSADAAGQTAQDAADAAATAADAAQQAADLAQAAVDAATAAGDAADAANQTAQDAVDAANAAADAATAAGETAQEAADAAKAATAAVTALASQVTSLMASLKAQITALTALVVKIQKKVKA